VFKAHTQWAKQAEHRGDIEQAQRHRDNRWRQCPNGPVE
jgi:hypothetical protein